jgi:hypothetical protein
VDELAEGESRLSRLEDVMANPQLFRAISARRSRSTLGVLVTMAALTSSACTIDLHGEGAVVSEQKTFPATGEVTLRLETFDGAIEVRSWERNEVSVEILRTANTAEEARALEVRASQDGNRITVEAPNHRTGHNIRIGAWRSPSVAFIVRAPRRMMLEAATGDGSITVGDLAGTLTLRSGDGAIRAENLEGRITASTGDGSISVHDSRGELDVDSGDGSIRLSGYFESLRVHSGDGSVTVDAAEGSEMKDDWSVTTGDGSVRVSLPSRFNAEIDAQSGDGRVTTDWSTERRDDENDEDRRTFRGRLGAGGRKLTIRSGDGSINLSRN